MSASNQPDTDAAPETLEDGTPEKLNLDVEIESRGACQRHVTVKIPREDIDRYYDNSYSELMGSASVPGFRPGRAPRKLIEARFREDVAAQVKSNLLMDALTQVTEERELAAISEPDFDPTAIELPESGALTFEFDLEVRPEFDLPEWKGLEIERPVRDFSDADVEAELQKVLAQRGRLVPHDGPAKTGDYIVTNLTFKHGDEKISGSEEEVIRIRPVLSFRDGKIEKFDKLMKGVKAGETREAQAKLTEDAPNEALRGKEVTAEFEVLEVKQLEMPTLTPEFLDQLGGFESEDELRDAVRKSLQRRLEYHQQRRVREQVLGALTVAADWELPPELLKRQSVRELQRAVLELQRSGFSNDEIRHHENELRQNSRAATARALKEHFLLERLAETESIEDSADDYDQEIELLAMQSGESPRRIRARLEKTGQMDALRNQIIERKTIDLIVSHAKFKDVPFELESADSEALDQAAGGEDEESDIPSAQYDDESKPLNESK